MSSIFDRAVEASFKRADDGYEFRCPNPWLLGSWRWYRVNEVQKRRLALCLRQRQRLVMRLFALYLLVGAALTVLLSGADSDPMIAGLFVLAMVTSLFAIAVVQHIYLMRKIAPVLAELPRTDEPTTLHDQIVGVAASVSTVPVVLGGAGGALVAAANIKSLVLELSEGSIGVDLIWRLLAIAVGLALAGYFGYLAILKRRLRQRR